MTATTTTRSTGADTSAAAVAPQKRTSLPTARYTLAQMRRSAGRLTAAGIAILIGTAFVAVTLLAGNVITRTTYDTVAARYADADVVVTTTGSDWREDVEALRDTEGVAAAEGVVSTYLSLENGNSFAYSEGLARPQDDRLMALELADGRWPSESGEVALPDGVSERLQARVGDEIEISIWQLTDPETGEGEEVTETLRVTGVTNDPYNAYARNGGAAVATAADIEKWSQAQGTDWDSFEIAAVLDPSALSDGEPTQAVRDALASAVVSGGEHSVQTVDERAAEISAEQTGGENLVFLVFVLTFAAVALVVAGLVIANTFQVLVAQRTRTLALLRCIGAGRGQLYRSVLLEAAVLGVLASLGGVVVGILLAQLALFIAPQFNMPVPLPTVVEITPQVVLIPLAVGVLVTLVAALAPARAATRVAPLAALRPESVLSLRKGSGRARAVFATLLTLGGFGLLGYGTWLGIQAAPQYGLLVAVAGGALSLVGVIMGSVFWLPKVTAFFGKLIGRSGPAARLASANTLRNPRRTSATATALLIGVTLIMTMATGAASARETADSSLNETFPMDILVQGGASAMPADTASRLADVGVVSGVAEVRNAEVTLDGLTFEGAEPGSGDDGLSWTLFAGDPAELRGAVRDGEALGSIEPGSILFEEGTLQDLGLSEGDVIDVVGPDGTVPLTVGPPADSWLFSGFVSLDDLTKLDAQAQTVSVWASLEQDVDPAEGLADVQEALNDDSLLIQGPAAQRAQFEQLINIMLGIVVGLLAVAVVIAVIGVANTLSLSVIERRRESATLRAIGLSKSQLRGMLAVEGLLIALVGAVLGIVLGLIYGWAGAATALSLMGDVTFTVPWLDLTVVLAVALVAGLIASVAPARTALKASPVEALASE